MVIMLHASAISDDWRSLLIVPCIYYNVQVLHLQLCARCFPQWWTTLVAWPATAAGVHHRCAADTLAPSATLVVQDSSCCPTLNHVAAGL